jgi:hypothetical protein
MALNIGDPDVGFDLGPTENLLAHIKELNSLYPWD